MANFKMSYEGFNLSCLSVWKKVGFLYWLISLKDKSFTLNCLWKLSLKSYINKNPPFDCPTCTEPYAKKERWRCLSSPLAAARQQHPKTVRKSSGLENIDQTLVKYSLHTEPRTHTLCFTSHCSSFLEQLAGVLSVFFFSPLSPPSSSFSSESLYISGYGVSPGPRHNAGVCSLGLLKPRPCVSDHTQTHVWHIMREGNTVRRRKCRRADV